MWTQCRRSVCEYQRLMLGLRFVMKQNILWLRMDSYGSKWLKNASFLSALATFLVLWIFWFFADLSDRTLQIQSFVLLLRVVTSDFCSWLSGATSFSRLSVRHIIGQCQRVLPDLSLKNPPPFQGHLTAPHASAEVVERSLMWRFQGWSRCQSLNRFR